VRGHRPRLQRECASAYPPVVECSACHRHTQWNRDYKAPVPGARHSGLTAPNPVAGVSDDFIKNSRMGSGTAIPCSYVCPSRRSDGWIHMVHSKTAWSSGSHCRYLDRAEVTTLKLKGQVVKSTDRGSQRDDKGFIGSAGMISPTK